jgi:hypothetical protein
MWQPGTLLNIYNAGEWREANYKYVCSGGYSIVIYGINLPAAENIILQRKKKA